MIFKIHSNCYIDYKRCLSGRMSKITLEIKQRKKQRKHFYWWFDLDPVENEKTWAKRNKKRQLESGRKKEEKSKIATHDPMLSDPTKGIKQAVEELCGVKLPFYLSTLVIGLSLGSKELLEAWVWVRTGASSPLESHRFQSLTQTQT